MGKAKNHYQKDTIKTCFSIYTMEYYSAIKKNAFESVLGKWMKLEPIIQSEVSQKKNGKNDPIFKTAKKTQI